MILLAGMSLRILLISIGINLVAAGIFAYFKGPSAGAISLVVGLMVIGIGYLASPDGYPKIIPLRYDKGPASPLQNNAGQWCKPDGTPCSTADVLRGKHWIGRYGLVIRNQGDSAFEVQPRNNIPVGTSRITFDGSLPNWAKDDGEGFFPINMELANGGGLMGGLFEEMRDKNIASVPITVTYKDSRGRRYKTMCRIDRNVIAPHGLAITDVHHGPDILWFLRRN